MTKKIIAAAILLSCFVITSVFAQSNQNILYVDIPSAEGEIKQLTQENSDMDAQNKELQAEILTGSICSMLFYRKNKDPNSGPQHVYRLRRRN